LTIFYLFQAETIANASKKEAETTVRPLLATARTSARARWPGGSLRWSRWSSPSS